MFQIFHDQLSVWLKERDDWTTLLELSHIRLLEQNTLPKKERLWRAYLLEILPKNFQCLFCRDPKLLQPFLRELYQLPRFPNHSRLKNLVLRQLPGVECPDSLCEKIVLFHAELDAWFQGEWHQSIQKNPLKALEKLRHLLSFDDSWACARFLEANGFLYPTGEKAFNGWIGYSNQKITSDKYEGWWRLLESLDSNLEVIYRTDYQYQLLFSAEPVLKLPSLCEGPPSCRICPLTQSCRYYSTYVNPNRKIELENLLRLQKAEEIASEDLLIYLAGERFQADAQQQTLIQSFPDLRGTTDQDLSDPKLEALHYFLSALREMLRRPAVNVGTAKGKSFTCSREIFEHIHYQLEEQSQEYFYTLILDNKHRLLRTHLTTQGILNRSLVHPREVFAPAIALRAAALVLIHNHPSGDPHPSRQDMEITKRLMEVGVLVGIKVLDHLIIGGDGYFSFIDEGVMPSVPSSS